MPTALFLSPHLDDVVFSCGGIAARLADAGWRTTLATAFTATVLPVTGFALACQTDKGLPPDTDYMALRRDEDVAAARVIGMTDIRWLDLPEAPHRGYHSAADLFGDLRPDDAVVAPLADRVETLVARETPDVVFAPLGLGSHVDHRQMIAAVLRSIGPDRVIAYRDTPYAIRDPSATQDRAWPVWPERAIPIAATLERKITAACAYRSQIGFQFGGADAAAERLRGFALSEGAGVAAERVRGEARLLDVLAA